MSSVLGSQSFEADIRRIKVSLGNIGTDLLIYANEQTSGVAGGNAVSGSWQTYPLNTERSDTGGYGSLASNQVTLAAGTYRVWASAVCYNVGTYQIRLYDTTNTAVLEVGSNVETHVGGDKFTIPSVLFGKFSLASSAVLEMQYRCDTTNNGDGLGIASGWGTEVYGQLVFWKE